MPPKGRQVGDGVSCSTTPDSRVFDPVTTESAAPSVHHHTGPRSPSAKFAALTEVRCRQALGINMAIAALTAPRAAIGA